MEARSIRVRVAQSIEELELFPWAAILDVRARSATTAVEAGALIKLLVCNLIASA